MSDDTANHGNAAGLCLTRAVASRCAAPRSPICQAIGRPDADPSNDLYGGGGLISTLQDQARFVTALLGGQGFRKPEPLVTILTNPATIRVGELGDGYGLGIVRTTIAVEVCWGHGGFLGSSAYHAPSWI